MAGTGKEPGCCGLGGLIPSATCEVMDQDAGETRKLTGKRLMTEGATVDIWGAPGAAP